MRILLVADPGVFSDNGSLAIFKGREATPEELAEKLGMPLENCWLVRTIL